METVVLERLTMLVPGRDDGSRPSASDVEATGGSASRRGLRGTMDPLIQSGSTPLLRKTPSGSAPQKDRVLGLGSGSGSGSGANAAISVLRSWGLEARSRASSADPLQTETSITKLPAPPKKTPGSDSLDSCGIDVWAFLDEIFSPPNGHPVRTSPYPVSPDRMRGVVPAPVAVTAAEVSGIKLLAWKRDHQGAFEDGNILVYFEREHETRSLARAPNSLGPHLPSQSAADPPIRPLFVPSPKMLWEKEWADYDPPAYTSPYILFLGATDRGRGVDATNTAPGWIHQHPYADSSCPLAPSLFNASGRPDFGPDGIPRHPIGRTGMLGRGNLGRWGANPQEHYIITRWRNDALHTRMTRYGAPLLEVLLCKKESGEWGLPGGFLNLDDEHESEYSVLMTTFGIHEDQLVGSEYLKELNMFLNSPAHPLKSPRTHDDAGRPLFDPRDTDNAWVEHYHRHIHLRDHERRRFKITDSPGNESVKVITWATVHGLLHLPPASMHELQRIVTEHGAFWGLTSESHHRHHADADAAQTARSVGRSRDLDLAKPRPLEGVGESQI